jgi:hypothetical protein
MTKSLDLAAYSMALTYLNLPDTNFILDGVLLQGEAKQELMDALYLRYKQMTKTPRGFERIEFTDDYGEECSIQESSSVTERIWLGINHVNPKIMKSDAVKLGLTVPFDESGWIPYPIPEQVLLSSRMHLNREQVTELVGRLQSWLESGEL